ncbi:MAG TPA: hypothetical protein VF541_04765 [Longimicrobium sp.]|jgi:hypothetical protein
MNLSFRTLFTLGVAHPYYAAGCRDFAFVIPAGTAARMRGGRLLARERDGTLHVLCELGDQGQPRARISGETLRFGLRLLNPYFGNFTQLPPAFPRQAPRYANAPDPLALAPAGNVRFAAAAFTHAVAAGERPATVTVRDATDVEVRAVTLAEGDARTEVSLDLHGAAPGRYVVEETAGGTTAPAATLYLDDELRGEAAVVVEVTVDDAFYDAPAAAPAALTVAFQPTADELRYYVVAPTADALDTLEVSDAGAAIDERDEIEFERVEHDQFADPDPPPSLLGGGSEDRVVLFRSSVPLPRSERGRRRIQLGRTTGEVLIPSLPQPGAERARAQMIIHLSKP